MTNRLIEAWVGRKYIEQCVDLLEQVIYYSQTCLERPPFYTGKVATKRLNGLKSEVAFAIKYHKIF